MSNFINNLPKPSAEEAAVQARILATYNEFHPSLDSILDSSTSTETTSSTSTDTSSATITQPQNVATITQAPSKKSTKK